MLALAEAVADTHWALHTERDRTEVVLGDIAAVRAAVAGLTT